MLYTRATPSKDQLFAVYQEGVSVDRYLVFRKKYKVHQVALAVTKLSDKEQVDFVDRSLNLGVSLEEITQVCIANVNLMRYVGIRTGRKASHKEAFEAAKLMIEDYAILTLMYGLTHDQIIGYYKEYSPVEGGSFAQYAEARNYGLSIEEAATLSGKAHYFDGDMRRALEVGITSTDLIDALTLDVDKREYSQGRARYYLEVREGAIARNLSVTHEQAMEVAENEHLTYLYLEARGKHEPHDKAMAYSLPFTRRPQVEPSRSSKNTVKTV